MKFSRFCIFKDNYPDTEHKLIYNTLSRAVVVLENNFCNYINNNDKNNTSYDNYADSLYNQGILVDNEDNEENSLNFYFTRVKSSYPSYSIMVLTTYDCNLACPYCFENEIKSINSQMDTSVINGITNWVKTEITKYNPKTFNIVYSGGEPLTNKRAIFDISSNIKKLCDEMNVVFKFGMLTNGTISFTTEELDDMLALGLDFIQITVDGPKKIHDVRRIRKDNLGTFDTIMKNIAFVKDKVSVLLRINIDSQNVEYVDDLLLELDSNNLNNIPLDLSPRFETPCDLGKCNDQVLSNDELGNKLVNICKKAHDLNIKVARRFTSNAPCLIGGLGQFVIDPLGDLYKCAGFAGNLEYKVGSVFSDKFNKKYIDFVGQDRWSKCKNCTFVPLCGGGCTFKEYVSKKNNTKYECERKIFDKVVMEILTANMDADKIKQSLIKNA